MRHLQYADADADAFVGSTCSIKGQDANTILQL